MKKLLLIFLCVFYTWSVSGVTITTHYCAGKISSVKLIFDYKKCACGNSSEKKSCCKDTHQFLKVKDSHQTASKIVVNTDVKTLVLMPLLDVFAYNLPENSAQDFIPYPLITHQRFIENCVFRI